MSDNFHPLVELLLARMKSHPEEFEGGAYGEVYATYDAPTRYRWDNIMRQLAMLATPDENDALTTAVRNIKLDALHREAMDELLNGDERRRKAEEDRIRWEQQSMVAKQGILTQQQMANSALNQLNSAYGSTLATATGVGPVNPVSNRSTFNKLLGRVKK